ncbi:hypothetical protein J2Z31_003649 [Sinorhizobium kostiense]|uniref:Capsular polysaccharide synthesis protein n=1 Tax=Sinorhizobium kostiense TaxID=76747 RepID=A0ABS4R473_9HYPH|nr:capsular polysaccharide synthesis protein [Sinorhizobium kostiense]MBP2237135.1 hypothetical protein [Sinorhizobium kostiense]
MVNLLMYKRRDPPGGAIAGEMAREDYMRLFKVFLLYKKLRHSFRRLVLGKKTLHFQNYSYGVEALPKKLEKVIWIYWDKPIEDAPPFVKFAIASWSSKNPEWQVNVLSDDTLSNFIDIDEPGGARKIQSKSDVIRLALLEQYGGVWVDATCCCVKPLDQWLLPLMQSGFFAFPEAYPGKIIVHSWFLASARGNYLVGKWSALARHYYMNSGKLGDYFWVMHLFEYIVRSDKQAAAIWNFTPKLSGKGPALLKRIISQPDYAVTLPETVDESAIPVLKISSSNKFNDQDSLGALESREDIPLRRLASIKAEAKSTDTVS